MGDFDTSYNDLPEAFNKHLQRKSILLRRVWQCYDSVKRLFGCQLFQGKQPG